MKNPTELACYLEGLEYGAVKTKATIDLLTNAIRGWSPFGEYSRGVIKGYERGIVHADFCLTCIVEKIKEAKEEIESSFEELASSDLGGEA